MSKSNQKCLKFYFSFLQYFQLHGPKVIDDFLFIKFVSYCKIFLIAPNKRIIGGDSVELTQMPFMVSIRPSGTATHIAGGAIIGPRWIVTGAFYVVNRPQTSLSVVAGVINLFETGTQVQTRTSTRILINPTYNSMTRANE